MQLLRLTKFLCVVPRRSDFACEFGRRAVTDRILCAWRSHAELLHVNSARVSIVHCTCVLMLKDRRNGSSPKLPRNGSSPKLPQSFDSDSLTKLRFIARKLTSKYSLMSRCHIIDSISAPVRLLKDERLMTGILMLMMIL